jgi:glyoxylase-like metal-dependent hydrolase (beta-lactamase superfamily II)
MSFADRASGSSVRLVRGVLRLTAPNPGLMTGLGTNSYVIGESECAVLDPGPDIATHVASLVAAAPGDIRWIVLTHTHPDHSPAAMRLKSATGATIVGRTAPADGRQDYATKIDQVVSDEELIGPPGHELRAIATPGHASNHVCYLHAASGLLFSGDHILNGSTTVILAPDGDMAAYLGALERLRLQPMSAIAPGHGDLLREPVAAIDALIAHRLRREAKTIERLRAAGRVTLGTLVPLVYDDVSSALHYLARFSLEAHLIKLECEGRVTRAGEIWSAGGSER